MTGNIPFLMKDVVLLAVSIYLLKQREPHVMRDPTTPIGRVAAKRPGRLLLAAPAHSPPT